MNSTSPSPEPVARPTASGSKLELGVVLCLAGIALIAYLVKYWPWGLASLVTPLEVFAALPVLIFSATMALTLGSERVVGYWVSRVAARPMVAWLCPVGVAGLYGLGIAVARQGGPWQVAVLALYLAIPVALALQRRLWADWGIALATWLPIQLGWVNLPNMPLPDAVAQGRYLDEVVAILNRWMPVSWHDLPILPSAQGCRQMQVHPLFAACVAFWAIMVVRRLPGFQFRLIFTKDDLVLGCKLFLGFAALALPIATVTGFGDWSSAFTLHKTETNAPAWALYPLLPLGMYLAVALVEEALFRGILQNLLSKTLRSDVAGWIVASLAFGAVHYKNGNPLAYAAFASCAGAVYGYAYRKTGRIMPGAVAHALVNSIWLMLFNPTWK